MEVRVLSSAPDFVRDPHKYVMRIHEITESYNIEGVEHEVPTSEYPLPEGYGEEFIDYLIDVKVGNVETAYFDYRDWLGLLDNLYTKGGDIYRAVFVKKGEEVAKPFGKHWSMQPLDMSALWRLWNDVCYKAMNPYQDNGYEMVLIHARTGPKNVTIEGVNVPEEYEEYEINLLNADAIEVVEMQRLPVPHEA